MNTSHHAARLIRSFAQISVVLLVFSVNGCVLYGQSYQAYSGYQPTYQPVYQPVYQPNYQSTYPATYQPVYQPANGSYPANNGAVTYPGPPVQANPQVVPAMSPEQIDQMTGPIALYPEPLLAELLPASTYPQQIQQAAQWLAYNPAPSDILINMQPWDASIKALVHYPSVLAYMNTNLNWTEALGVAFLNQQADVMASIQRLRAAAIAAGTLQSNPQQQVISQNGIIWIEPSNPQILYVPQYNPGLVFVSQPNISPGLLITFGFGFGIGTWLNNDCNWHQHWITTGDGWQRNWQRDNRGRWLRRDNGPRRDRNGARWNQPAPRQWTRDRNQPLPALRPDMIPRGGLRQYRGWQPSVQPNRGPRFNPGFQGRPGSQPQRNRKEHPANVPAWHPPVFGGTYRNQATVNRQMNRGRQSLRHSAYQPRNQGGPARGRSGPDRGGNAFQIRNSNRQVQQQSQRGRRSMRHKR